MAPSPSAATPSWSTSSRSTAPRRSSCASSSPSMRSAPARPWRRGCSRGSTSCSRRSSRSSRATTNAPSPSCPRRTGRATRVSTWSCPSRPQPPGRSEAMGELGGFLKIHRVGFNKRDPHARVHDYKQYFRVQPEEVLKAQGARCMDCGVPFCHDGCPLGNLIPDWNDLVYHGRWREAIDQLHATNNFPEFTGLICPAPCESACVLAIDGVDNAVMIKQIEYAIVHRAWEEDWIKPVVPAVRSGRRIAVVGSGPAGLAVAQQLNHGGHSVVVFERDEGPGGLLRFGVPDAKLEKWIIDRRVAVLTQEGIEFRYGVDVGRDLPVEDLREQFDAVVVATGSRVPRDISIAGRDLAGVETAMDYLYQRNRAVAREEQRPFVETPADKVISA